MSMPASSNSTYSNNSRPSSMDSMSSQKKALQYHTTASRSSRNREKVEMPHMFRRSIIPRTHQFLNKSYFIPHQTPDKFKDVRPSGRCLRCYGQSHKADSCATFRLPCVYPCRLCVYLYHKSADCIFFHFDGKPKGSPAKN
jgi:nitrate reductase cytochrome c-type subunit